MTLELTTCQATVIKTMLELLEIREREPPTKKKTNVNVYTIKEATGKEPKSIKIALNNIKKQFKEIA